MASLSRLASVFAVGDRHKLIDQRSATANRDLAVPDELSVIGFDDVAFATTTDPPLTTVHQPHREKGVLAGEALFTLLGGDLPPATSPLATRLVVRNSTGPPPAGS